MSRQKTTVYLDADVVTAVKVLAATRQQSSSDLIETAVLAYLVGADAQSARTELHALMSRLAERSTLTGDALTDEDAMTLAINEVHAARAEGQRVVDYISASPSAQQEMDALRTPQSDSR